MNDLLDGDTPAPEGPSRLLRVLPVPPGPAVVSILPDLAEMARGDGPALLPVPADDPVRSGILTRALRPGEPIDARAALVACTSGSTGRPKGAMLSAGALAASADATHEVLGGPGVWVLALPAHHIAGLQVLLRSLRAGFDPVVVDVSTGFDPGDLPAAVDRLADAPRSYISLVPGQLAKVLDPATGSPAAVAALTAFDAVLLGGAGTDPGLLAAAERAGITVVRTYGMSETAGGCVYDGLPLPGVSVDVDAEGRIWLAGPQLAVGYRDDPGHRAFSRPGWFRTDDAGRIDPDGRLRIRGRLDAALTVGGLTVLPQEVERALTTHPAIAEAVVVGLADPRLGQRPVAVVVLRRDRPRPTTAQLRAHVTAQLGAHSAPAGVTVVDALPELPGGKVDRRAVADGLADGTIGE